jgi:hypothetical protein
MSFATVSRNSRNFKATEVAVIIIELLNILFALECVRGDNEHEIESLNNSLTHWFILCRI